MAAKHETPKVSIILIEDDLGLGALLEEFLNDHGYDVRWERRGDVGRRRILEDAPDLVVLDLALPSEDGISICRSVRPHFDGGIIILTARSADEDQVEGLSAGADDYIVKPPNPPVLLARINSVLRRRKPPATVSTEASYLLVVGELTLDRSRLTTTVAGRDVALTTTEFEVLWCLAQKAGSVVDRETLYTDGLGAEWNGFDRRIDVYLSKIRRKLYEAGLPAHCLKSVRARGYLLAPS